METDSIEIQRRLDVIAAKLELGDVEVSKLRRLSGGASHETWCFDVADNGFILRRAPGGGGEAKGEHTISLETEALTILAAQRLGAPTPDIVHVCTPEDQLGSAFLMRRMAGETIARKILRNDEFTDARPKLARQCGAALAKIHATSIGELPALAQSDAIGQLNEYEKIYRRFRPRPIFELAFKHLRDHAPKLATPALVHGDFRNGNLIIGPEGLRGVLDWELAHIGDPREDLGWICVNSWRFGETSNPVGGFGALQDMLDGYAEEGGAVFTPAEIKYWEMLGTLKWGVMCLIMYDAYSTGADPSVERAAIGRRASETEIDLINIFHSLEPVDA